MPKLKRINRADIDFSRVDDHLYMKFKDEGEWYGLYKGDELVCFACVKFVKNYKRYRLCSLYTFKEFRRKGYGSELVSRLLDKYGELDAIAMETSKRLFESIGFKLERINEYKHITTYHMHGNQNN